MAGDVPALDDQETSRASAATPPEDVSSAAHPTKVRDEPSWCLEDAARLTGFSVMALRKLAVHQQLLSWKEAGAWRVAHSHVVLLRRVQNPELAASAPPFTAESPESAQTVSSMLLAVGVGLTPRSATAACGLDSRQLRRLANGGQIRAFHTPGGHIRYPKDDIQRIAQQDLVPQAS